MINDTKAILIQILSGLSVGGFSIGVGFDDSKPKWAHSSYDQQWIDHYVSKGFLATDPTIQHGQQHSGHWTWIQMAAFYPGNSVFRAAARFGLTEGNTISMRINGLSTIASCAGPEWTQPQLAMAQAAISGLHFLHAPSPIECPYSDRVLEVLKLMCDGHRDKEIADILGVKLETIRKRRSLALTKTNTSTTPECIRLSIKNGWL